MLIIHNDNTEARPVILRLDHMPAAEILRINMGILNQRERGRNHYTASSQHVFCQNLVHGDGRRGQTAMCIGNIHNIQQALKIAIFANLPVQGVKHATRLKFGKFGGNIAVNLDLCGSSDRF